MNMNKKAYSLVLLVALLSGCQTASIPLEYIQYSDIDNPSITFKKEKGDIYYRNDSISPLQVNKIDGVNIKTGVYSYSNLNDITTAFEDGSYSLISNNFPKIIKNS